MTICETVPLISTAITSGLVAAVITAIFAVKENRKKRMLENYTKRLFNDLDKLVELSKAILLETDLDLIEINNGEINVKNIVEKCGEIEFDLKRIYELDRNFIRSSLWLKKCALEYKENKIDGMKLQLECARREFRKFASLFRQASWKHIKEQILTGKEVKNFFNETYKNIEKEYKEVELSEQCLECIKSINRQSTNNNPKKENTI